MRDCLQGFKGIAAGKSSVVGAFRRPAAVRRQSAGALTTTAGDPPTATGVVAKFDMTHGFGFITPEGDETQLFLFTL